MTAMDVAEIAVFGTLAGVTAGMFGVGGGVLFVPLLTLVLGLGQVDAEGTSLLAMIPVALIGSVRNHRQGLIDLRRVAVIGLASAAAAVVGALAAHRVPEVALRKAFGVFVLIVATQLVRRAIRERRARLAPQ